MMKQLLGVGALVAGLLLAGAAAHAEVTKCKAADGRVVYSDQPCSGGQTGSPVPGVANKAGSGGAGMPSAGKVLNISASAVGEARDKALHARVAASISPECRSLGARLGDSLAQDSESDLETTKRLLTEFEQRCSAQLEQAWKAERGKGNQPLDAASCRTLRQVRDDARAQLSKMTNKEKMEYAKLQNEVSVACP
jgi:hypothetical protein